MIGAVVDCQRVRDSIEFEGAFGNAISIAADERAKIRMALEIGVEIIKPQNYVAELPGSIGHLQHRDDAAIVGNFYFGAATILQSVKSDALALRCFAEITLLHSGLTVCVNVECEYDGAYQKRK